MDIWPEVLSVLNAALALLVACLALYDLFCAPSAVRWLKVAYAILGLYWFAIYVFVSFADSDDYNSVMFGQVFIRPAFTLTLATMAAALLYRAKSGSSRCRDAKNSDDVQ